MKIKNPQYLQDRLDGLTGPEHSYTSISGLTVALTAKQIARGHYTPLWRAEKAHAEAWHAVHTSPAHSVYERDAALVALTEAERALKDARSALVRRPIPRCQACGCRLEKVPAVIDARAGSRCPDCAQHFAQKKVYTNPIQKARSKSLTVTATKDKRNAKHCPKCHHFRPRKSFLVFNDRFGSCEVCRDEEWNEQRIEQRKKKFDAWASKEAERLMAVAKEKGIL
jgi:hypothetical protein